MSRTHRPHATIILMNANLVKILLDTYDPLAIILHGSYAREDNLPESDIDIYIVVESVNEASKKRIREFEGHILDLDFLTKEEVISPSINERFGYNLSDGKVLFDTDDIAKTLVENALALYSKGRNLTEDEIEARKYFYTRSLGRLRDSVDSPVSFEVRFGDLYGKLPRYWCELKQDTWGKSIRSTVKEMQEKDIFYLNKLELLPKETNEGRITILIELFDYLFSTKG